MIINYSAKQTYSIIGIDRHLLKTLRGYGLLVGRNQGGGYYYDSDEINKYILATRGLDLSNEDKIKYHAPIIRQRIQKKVL